MSKLTLTKSLAISIATTLPLGVFLVAKDEGKIVYANPKAEDTFGYLNDELLGLYVEELIPERYHRSHKALRQNYVVSPQNMAMNSGRVVTGLRKNGVEFSLQIGITPLDDKYILLSCIESSNEIIKPSSSNDPLTGLPNRKVFDEYSDKLHKLAIRNNKSISIAFIDLDKFKSVNDQFGHHIGDVVICEVANKLIHNVRTSDIIARVGGDEFIICLYDIGNRAHLKRHLERLISQISSISNVEGNSIDIGASIGSIITSTPQNVQVSEMITQADKLMYKAKKTGKGLAVIGQMDASNLIEY
jgi:diguanylate cyclase (GGDEF)-like protein/PAS domain S-box-containing protein